MEQRTRLGMEMLPSLHKRLKTEAARRGMKMWEATHEAITAWIDRRAVRCTHPERTSEEAEAVRLLLRILRESPDPSYMWGSLRGFEPPSDAPKGTAHD